MTLPLRPYQTLAANGVQAAFVAGHKRPLVVMPTGAGKTVTFADQAELFPGPVLIYAHRRELVRQAAAKLTAAGVDHGIIAPGWKPRDARVQIGSIQSLAGKALPPFGLLIPDEAHHAVTGSYRDLRASQRGALVTGYTATPERLDGTGLGGVFDALVIGPTVKELQAEGHLCPVRVYGPDAGPDPRDGGPPEKRVIGDAVEHWLWHAPDQPTICFCPSVAAAETTAAEFRARGVLARAVDGKTNPMVRDSAIAGLGTGSTEVLCVCDLVSEGLDIPGVCCVIMLRRTDSLGMFLQQIGRGLRVAEGKDDLVVLDHAGNTLRHGMPNADREWTLDGAQVRKADRVPAIRQCSTCWAIHPPAPACPCCGAVSGTANDNGPRKVRRADGTLRELTESDVRILATPLKDLLREARGRDDIDAIATARGYAKGWVHIQMKYWKPPARETETAAEEFAA